MGTKKKCYLCGKEFDSNSDDTDVCPSCMSNPKLKYCKLCSKPFIPYGRQLICKRPHIRTCPNCGKEFDFTRSPKQVYCSAKCRGEYESKTGKRKEIAKKTKSVWKEKYGVDNVAKLDSVKEKKKQVCLEKYGVEHPWMNSKVQAKRQQTLLERYGSVNPLNNEDIKKKSDDTCMRKYGTVHPAQNEEVKERTRQYFQEKYGVNSAMQVLEFKEKNIKSVMDHYGFRCSLQSEEVRNKGRKTVKEKYGDEIYQRTQDFTNRVIDSNMKKFGTPYAIQNRDVLNSMRQHNMEKYGVGYTVMLPSCYSGKISSINKSFHEFLQENGIDSELEFALPEKSYDLKVGNTLVELDPTYTHNSHHSHYHKDGLPPDYHLNRTLYAEEHGYRCIHVWDWDDWKRVSYLLTDKKPVPARKCYLDNNLDYKTCKDFLNWYHIQGSCNGQKVNYGLYIDGTLIGIMTFGKPRYNKHYQWELLRLCYDPRYRVVGGSERMFKHFVEDHDPESIISYCDRSKFSGDVYYKLGMSLKTKPTPTKHWYSDNPKERMQHITHSFLRQRGYDQIFGANFGKGTSNEELILARGYLPVYDCGQMTFEWHKETS